MNDSNFIIHLSKKGNNQWSGCHAKALADGSDGPCLGPQQVLRKVRSLRQNGCVKGPIEIRIQAGDYFFSEPMRLNAMDRDLHWIAMEEGVRFHSGITVSDWSATTINGVACWSAALPPCLRGREVIRSLFVNGERRSRPLSIHEGWHHFESVPGLDPTISLEAEMERLFDGSDTMVLPEGLIQKEETSLEGVEILVSHFWVMERLALKSYDPLTRVAITKSRSLIALRDDHTGAFARFKIENLKSDLKNPGEWHLDLSQHKIYYLPLPGEKINAVEIQIPMLSQLFLIEGGAGAPITGLKFEKINFTLTESLPPQNFAYWSEPYRLGGVDRYRDSAGLTLYQCYLSGVDFGVSPQAAYELPGVLHFRHAEDCVIKSCRFNGLGSYAIVFEEGAWNNEVSQSRFWDLGAGAIQMDGADWKRGRDWQNGLHRIADNEIQGTGMIYPAAAGILSMFSSRNRIQRNHIHHTSYTGISCGWEWGLAPHISQGHQIEENYIHHIGVRGGLSDLGAIYLLGRQPGTYVSRNVIHDVSSSTYGGCGIYLDEGSCMVTVESNLIFGKVDTALNFHKTRDLIIRWNALVVQCRKSGITLAGCRSEEVAVDYPPDRFILEKNLILVDGTCPAIDDWQLKAERKLLFAELNLYGTLQQTEPLVYASNPAPHLMNAAHLPAPERCDWNQWQKKGYDLAGKRIQKHSLTLIEGGVRGLKELLIAEHFPIVEWSYLERGPTKEN